MVNILRKLVIMTGLLMVGITIAHADINLSRTPASINIPLGQPTAITVTWILDPFCFGNGTGTVSSPNGIIQIGSSQISIGSPFSRVMQTGARELFTETILIPASISTQAVNAGVGIVTYGRTFTSSNNCTQPSSSDSVSMQITSSSAAGFSVSRVALSFDAGGPVRVIERKQALRANADVNFNGNGMLQAQWEVASPPSTSGEPTFRPIATVRQYLVGSDTQTIPSPALPTDNAGLYLVRLRVTEPSPTFDIPVIRYFVTDPQTPARGLPAAPLGLVTPPNQTLLAPDTTFVWETIPGTRAYQLEIYAKPRLPGDTLPDLGSSTDTAPLVIPPTPPITGMLVAGAQTGTALSETARAHLLSGQRYLWRVLAVGADGIIGESTVREIRMP